jgi:hypothetical protein
MDMVLTFLASVLFEPFAAVAALVVAMFIGLALVSMVSDGLPRGGE